MSTATAALCPSNRLLALFRPCRISGSWTDTSRSFAPPCFSAGPASCRSTSWTSTRLSSPAASTRVASAALPASSPLRTSRACSNSRSASATISPSNRRRSLASPQSIAAVPFRLVGPTYRPYPGASAHAVSGCPASFASTRASFRIPSPSRLSVSLTAPRPRMFVVSSATFSFRFSPDLARNFPRRFASSRLT